MSVIEQLAHKHEQIDTQHGHQAIQVRNFNPDRVALPGGERGLGDTDLLGNIFLREPSQLTEGSDSLSHVHEATVAALYQLS